MTTSVVPTPTSPTSVTGSGSATATGSNNALGKLGSDAFLKLLVAQLRYQNPFSPSDPSAMLGQVAMFTQVESLQKIQASQSSSASLDQARMASEVIGRKVTGTDSAGAALSGVVSSARFTPTGPMLVLDSGNEMPLANMETMAPAVATGPAAASSGSSSASTSSDSSSAAGTNSPAPTTKASAISAAANSAVTTSAAPTPAAPTPVVPSGTVRSVVADVASWALSSRIPSNPPAGLLS